MGDNVPSKGVGGNPESPEGFKDSLEHSKRQDGSPAETQSPNLLGNLATCPGPYQQLYASTPTAFSRQLEIPFAEGSNRQGPYDMNPMMNALPQSEYGYSNGQPHQRYPPNGPPMPPHNAHYHGYSHMPPPQSQPCYMQYSQAPPYYDAQATMNTQHQQQQHQLDSMIRNGSGTNYEYYGNMLASQPQAPIHSYYIHQPNLLGPNSSIHNHATKRYHFSPDGNRGEPGVFSPPQRNHTADGFRGSIPSDELTRDRPNNGRGPPRKPRQTGHAIWIGNLPPQTDLMSLVYHICKEASGLQSLFLISKSNCAFANFTDETYCIAAQQKLHDSKFQSVRLVSRLRKSTVEGASGQTAPTGPAATSPSVQVPIVSEDPTIPNLPSKPATSSSTREVNGKKSRTIMNGALQKDKFFILKSLTVDDLDLSTQNGVWATQSHNEVTLNEAFETADNVYLIFSANKSGEYYGYARMSSAINQDPAAAIEFAPKVQAMDVTDLPKAISTEATETCPRGRIIDDSARGTIFWEVERDEEVDGVPDTVPEDSEKATGTHEGEAEPKAWGKPFTLEWLSTIRLPFYKVRGMRNPWNSHREVKIARDGTELEPDLGRKLIGLFARVESPGGPLSTMGMTPGYYYHGPQQFY